MATRKTGPQLQPYPRQGDGLLAANHLFPKITPPLRKDSLCAAIDDAFDRCLKNKQGVRRQSQTTPQELVAQCLVHLRERSDPILSPYFLSQCKPQQIFQLDAVAHEMQRHRMTIGVFYQYLMLALMRARWPVFDGYREGDIVAEVDTPGFLRGLRLYMSVKKSADTVAGQDVGGVIHRLESLAKHEKNLTRPYLCVICVATPPRGVLRGYDDRKVRCNQDGAPYSLNCEVWGPGFIFPYLTGTSAIEIYLLAVKRVSDYLPFMTLRYGAECAQLLTRRLRDMRLLDTHDRVDPEAFVRFCNQVDGA